MTILNTILNIIQWKRLLYLVFVLYLFKYCFLYGFGFNTVLSFYDLAILATSITSLIASSHLILHYNNIKKSKDSLLKYTKIFAFFFGVIGLTLGTLISYKIDKPHYSLFFFSCMILLFIYSKKIKQKTFMSNILKPFLKSFVVLFVCWYDFPLNITSSKLDLYFNLQVIVILYVIISFLTSIIKEIIIDIKNINQDNFYKNKTLPVLLGRRRSKNIAMTITVLACFLVVFIAFFYVTNVYIRCVIISFGIIPELFFIYFLNKALNSDDYSNLLRILNVGYVLAFISIPIISYHLKHVI
ncbi:UbiA family prenyltransferase [Tenacibaculum bernardetii]|uniref:UbiA family prenyltransferase n=1 Tax=Tenacibaculum bernardetii TaxID=3021375 RepID=UPI0023B12C7A|nr:UbiA family prenyltransferase [Tenacibaculum bernardetii]